ncbi:DUF4381 domain-containing protein [Marinomonas sp. A79]|uniref:DUF4381 domain-containing protein n=1 Tax=Marinomonas vulgaris TaxID=2823372 RepID=A0ABS5HC07_9GAMM|nr:DUF4381 domain-containing protein [Marinomonas vulgaris]MBR7889198.1 DUF4381 domain-containing protein [Marinomonas vulgaris]
MENTPTPPLELPNKAYLLPDNIPMWPPVWWTWLLVAALLIAITALGAFYYKRHQKRTYRREACQAITQSIAELSDKESLLLCHEMVRRCLVSEGKQHLVSLPSAQLFAQLDEQLPGKKRFSSLGAGFIDGPYRPVIELNEQQRADMIAVTLFWIRKHHA